MLSDYNGRVYREVLFRRLDVKKLWPKSAVRRTSNFRLQKKKTRAGGRPITKAHISQLHRPILQEMEAATPKMRGRKKKGDGSYANIDLPLLDEMKELISSHRAASPEEAARMLAKKAHGSGSEESKAERLAKRYRENASGPNSLGSGS